MYNLRRQAFIAFLMMFAFAFATVRAEINATLKGRVVDAKTGEALVGATLQVLQAGKTAVSDEKGNFTFMALGQRNYTLTAVYLGRIVWWCKVAFRLNRLVARKIKMPQR